MERRSEFAAANLQAESYLEREHNARWAGLAVAHATSGITAANVLTLPLPRSILACDQLYLSNERMRNSRYSCLLLLCPAQPIR
jgi:hypothetical protein